MLFKPKVLFHNKEGRLTQDDLKTAAKMVVEERNVYICENTVNKSVKL